MPEVSILNQANYLKVIQDTPYVDGFTNDIGAAQVCFGKCLIDHDNVIFVSCWKAARN